MFFPALLAKFLCAGAVAQAASGVGIAVVAFTGAGATGLLGNDVQTTLTSVVGVADATGDVSTPDAAPAATETETPETATPAVQTPAVQTPAVETPSPAPAELSALAAQAAGPTPGEKFSAWVHRAFPDGKADGRIVSEWARNKHVDLSNVEGVEDVEGIDDSASSAATPTAEVETEHFAEATHGNSGGTSRHGGGNSGRGDN